MQQTDKMPAVNHYNKAAGPIGKPLVDKSTGKVLLNGLSPTVYKRLQRYPAEAYCAQQIRYMVGNDLPFYDVGAVFNNDKYRMAPCKTWEAGGDCQYKHRCHFSHGALDQAFHAYRRGEEGPMPPKDDTLTEKYWNCSSICEFGNRLFKFTRRILSNIQKSVPERDAAVIGQYIDWIDAECNGAFWMEEEEEDYLGEDGLEEQEEEDGAVFQGPAYPIGGNVPWADRCCPRAAPDSDAEISSGSSDASY